MTRISNLYVFIIHERVLLDFLYDVKGHVQINVLQFDLEKHRGTVDKPNCFHLSGQYICSAYGKECLMAVMFMMVRVPYPERVETSSVSLECVN